VFVRSCRMGCAFMPGEGSACDDWRADLPRPNQPSAAPAAGSAIETAEGDKKLPSSR
jgi:hypothetical protein